MEATTRAYLEVGKTWVFACALDLPGWCRRGKGEEAAIEALMQYADRYAVVAGPEFAPGEVTVVGRLPGNATTDFGAPDAHGGWDDEPLDAAEAARQADLLAAAWRAFDGVVAAAPPRLRKGPRGGGRDRDAVADHVRESERNYGRMVGVRMPPDTPWIDQRATILNALRSGLPGGRWPARYALRRLTWHVLDHAWEIEDKS